VYGSPSLEGCQAEYFRQPLADGSLFPIPKELREEGFPLEVLLLLADVLPTGYCSAFNARRLLVRDTRDVRAKAAEGRCAGLTLIYRTRTARCQTQRR
jgi:hypothetical protein